MRFERSGDKRSVLEGLLEQSMVLVTLDARYPEVSVPDHLRHDPQLRLNLSYNFEMPVVLDDAGIHATLTFGGERHDCALPWHSVYMFVAHATGQPVIFPADVPEETLLEARQELEEGSPTDDRQASAPRLQLVAGEGAGDGEDGEDPPPPATPPRRGHLRVVK